MPTREYLKRWRKLNPGKAYEHLKRWRKKHPDRYRWYQKMYRIYGKKANWPL